MEVWGDEGIFLDALSYLLYSRNFPLLASWVQESELGGLLPLSKTIPICSVFNEITDYLWKSDPQPKKMKSQGLSPCLQPKLMYHLWDMLKQHSLLYI